MAKLPLGGPLLLAPLLLLALALAAPAQAQLAISQVYGGGGNAGAPYTHDFVELFNRGESAISLDELSLQYASATGTGNFGANANQLLALPAVELQPGQYFLAQLAGGSNGEPLPAADAVGTINMAGAAGKIALVSGTASLGCNGGSTPCSEAQLARIVDLVGYGNANFFEGSAAAPTLSNTRAGHRADGGCTDTDDNAADFTSASPAPRNSASPLLVCGAPPPPPQPTLSIEDLALAEGDSGTTAFDFRIVLSAPAAGPVSVDVETADGTATVADNDYLPRSERITLAAGETLYLFTVEVVGDTRFEADETFFVRLSNIDGAELGRAEAVGTILNDDPPPQLAISTIQGAGLGNSPWLGMQVSTVGIVTAQRVNGYFIQSAPEDEDGDPTTAEGLFVFTGGAGVPAAAAIGNRVRVEGTVTQFARTPHGYAQTQLGNATATVLAEGQPLPAAIALGADDLSPTGHISRLGRYQGMRVSLPATRVVGPSNRFGDFYVTLADVARPFREPGIAELDAVPLPEGHQIPRFDMNPERLRVESTGLADSLAVDVDADSQLAGMHGVMYYDRGDFTLLLDPAAELAISGGAAPLPAPARPADAIAIAAFNIENLAGGDNVPAHRLQKLTAAFCQHLHTPDIVGLVEIADLQTMQRLARAINDDEFGHCPDDPQYQAYLLSDRGNQRLGFLVSTREVRNTVPRVEVIEVAEEAANDWLIMPDGGSTSLLFDRPPLRLTATVNHESGASYPLTLIANHLLSLLDVNSLAVRNDSWETAGNRSRHKRMQQAVRLGEIVQARQQADPDEPIILLGDFNAFEFSDGYVDVMGIITGHPAPANEVLLWADSPLNPPLHNLAFDVPADQRYSYVFQGNNQVLDHIVVNQAVQGSASASLHYVRLNADYASDNAADASIPLRNSDHDPALAYLIPAEFARREVDLHLAISAPRTPIVAGRSGQFALAIGNHGIDAAPAVRLVVAIGSAADTVEVAPLAGGACAVEATDSDNSLLRCEFDGELAAGDSRELALTVTPRRSGAQSFLTLHGEVSSAGEETNPDDNTASASVRVTGKPGG
jgi:uncharacterized protein